MLVNHLVQLFETINQKLEPQLAGVEVARLFV